MDHPGEKASGLAPHGDAVPGIPATINNVARLAGGPDNRLLVCGASHRPGPSMLKGIGRQGRERFRHAAMQRRKQEPVALVVQTVVVEVAGARPDQDTPAGRLATPHVHLA